MRRSIYRWTFIMMAFTFCAIPGYTQIVPPNSNSVIQPAWERDSLAKVSQSLRVDGGVVQREKYSFHWETHIEPPTPNPIANGFTTRTSETNGVIHRIMIDRTGKTYFGYDVMIEALPDNNSYRVTFRPLVMQAEMMEGLTLNRGVDWNNLAAPRFPPAQIVRGGEILELTLLTNDQTNQRIVDYVSIQEPDVKGSGLQPPQERSFSFTTGVPRDITANDIQMMVKAPRLSVNGKLEESTVSHFDEVTGTFVWFYVPGHGLFIMSLGPHAERGFRKAGEVRGSSLEFNLGQNRYTLSTGARIAPGEAAYNLYLIGQPDWKGANLVADTLAFTIGATDQFESIGK